VRLSTTICGVYLKNRSVLASGILGVTLSSLRRVYKEGAGIVTSKSIGVNPRKGHRGPVIYDYGAGLINAVGLSNPGIESFLEQNREYGVDFPLIVSFFGEKIEDYQFLASKLNSIGCDFLEVNISCPNVEDEFGRPFSYSAKLTRRITKSVKDSSDKPVIIKLSPNTPEIIEIALAAQEAGADCINVINTVGPGMIININTGYPILSNLKGGVSGDAVLPLTIRYVYDLYEKLTIPIMGTGGISNTESALQVLMAGASLFGVGTAVYTEGISVFNDINQGILDFMNANRIDDLQEIIGISHRLDRKSNFYFTNSTNQHFEKSKWKKNRTLLTRPEFVVKQIKEIVDDSDHLVRQIYMDLNGELTGLPGQFYMLWLPGIDFKPYSIFYQRNETIGFAVANRGNFSRQIFRIETGDPIGLLGPLGNGFNLTRNNYLLLAGGVGLAPILFAAEKLLELNKKVAIAFGVKRAMDLNWFKRYIDKKASNQLKSIDVFYITEDGSIGEQGLITDHVEKIVNSVNPDFVLACGPELFIKKSAEICHSLGLEGQTSIERVMKCGIGLCGSCSLDDNGTRVCKEGPVFSFDEILGFSEYGKYKRDESGRIIDI